jgi:hypothetical protein
VGYCSSYRSIEQDPQIHYSRLSSKQFSPGCMCQTFRRLDGFLSFRNPQKSFFWQASFNT